jgi:hypothetical protein
VEFSQWSGALVGQRGLECWQQQHPCSAE